MRVCWPLVLSVGVIAAGLPAQFVFEQQGRRHFPLDDAQSARVSLADFDGDGDLDAVATTTGSSGYRQRFYRNDGTGVFAPHAAWPVLTDHSDHLVADFDGDLRPDVLIDGAVILNGGGVFTRIATTPTWWPIAFGDMDGDGQGDLLARHGSGQAISLWRKAGNTFVPAPAGSVPTTNMRLVDAALRDFDGDGDRDLLIAAEPYSAPFTHWPGNDRLWRNDGSGTFTETYLPGAGDVVSYAMAADDFDGDGDQDCAILTTVSFFSREWQLRLNDGTGNLVVVPGRLPVNTPFDRCRAVDLDRDGDADLVWSGAWLENDGSARFTLRTLAAPWARSLATGDVDGDNDVDLVLGVWSGNDGMNRLLLNDGNQQFVDATAFPWPGTAAVAGRADVDRDGDVDLLARQGALHLNDGTGWFTAVPFPWVDQTATDVHFVDVDGDLDPDALFTSTDTAGTPRMRLCRNDGLGGFVDASQGNTPASMPRDIAATAVLDAEGDGDVDYLVAVYRSGLQLFVNDGTGRFATAPGAFPPLADWFRTVAVGDFDRDGDVDVLTGESNSQSTPGGVVRLLQNDGTGRFVDVTASRVNVASSQVVRLVTGDVDGDSDLDVVVACWGTSSYPGSVNHLLVNNGTGTLTQVPGRLPTTLPSGLAALGDLDLDGDLDCVAGTYDQGVRLWRNNGTGTFADVGQVYPHTSTPFVSPPELLDLDGDDDIDLVLDQRMFVNRHWSADAPLLARTGLPFVLRLRAGPSANGSGHAWQFFSSQRTQLSLAPYGALMVDPNAAFLLPPVPLSAGETQVSHSIPADPRLVGMTVAIQAWFSRPAGGHLSPGNLIRIHR